MLTSSSPELDEAALEVRLKVLSWLEETFACDFHFAVHELNGDWCAVAADVLGIDNAYQLSEVHQLACSKAMQTRSVQVEALDSATDSDIERQPNQQRHLVAIPLLGGGATPQIACGEVVGQSPDALQRTGKLWMTAAQAKQSAERAQIENDYFAEQLSEDLEELTFLRSMVAHLEVSGTENDLFALAEATLPLLNESVKSECLSLLMVSDEDDPLDATPTISVGSQGQSDALLAKIVRWFGSAALEQPVVKNQLSSTPEGKAFGGVREFVLVPLAARNRQMGWLLAINRVSTSPRYEGVEWPLSQTEFGTSEASLLSTTASILATHASNLDLFREKEQMLVNVVRSLVSALDAKDEYTCGHSERVALFGRLLAEQAGYDEQACERLYMTGLLHDVGKIGVSDYVLKKDGALTDEEFAEIKRHPDEGWSILHDLEQLNYVLPGVLYHHERYDGAGYPDGLAGNEIPLDGRILAVVDAYDAMTSDRPYRPGMPPEKAQAILRDGAGTQWDAELVDAFFTALPRIERVRNTYQIRERAERKGIELPANDG